MRERLNLTAFERRVRLVASWRGAAYGLLAGSIVACTLVAVVRIRGHILPWPYAAAVALLLCVLGAVWAATRRIATLDLADSVDRRAGLKNRLASAMGAESEAESGISAALQDDASTCLNAISPSRVYPVQFGRLQCAAIAVALIAGLVTLLGNRPIVLSAAQRARAADNAEAASSVERVLDPYKEAKPTVLPGKLEKSEVAEMEKLARDLRSGDADREEALKRANKALEDAKKLEAKAADKSKEGLAKAETAMQALAKADSSDTPFDPSAEMTAPLRAEASDVQQQIDALKKQLAGASSSQAAALQNQIAKLQDRLNSLNKQISNATEAEAAFKAAAAQHQMDERQIQDALRMDSPPGSGGGMDPLAEFKALKMRMMAMTQEEIANIKERLKTATGAEAERLRKKLADLEAQLDSVKKEVEAYNKALKAALKAARAKQAAHQAQPSQPMLHTKFNKPMLSTLTKLKQALNKIQSGDDLSKEESDALKKAAAQMDVEAAKAAASDDKERAMTAAVLADAARALADGNAAVAIAKACRGALSGMGIPEAILHQGAGGPDDVSTKDEHNIGKVNHLDKPAAGRGKTTPTVVDPLKGEGPESYIEIRGPASLGARSAIPYRSVLPSYQRKEEAALTGGQIPKKHQKRVRAYFDSLNGR